MLWFSAAVVHTLWVLAEYLLSPSASLQRLHTAGTQVFYDLAPAAALLLGAGFLGVLSAEIVKKLAPLLLTGHLGVVAYEQISGLQGGLGWQLQFVLPLMATAYILRPRATWLVYGTVASLHLIGVASQPQLLPTLGDWIMVHAVQGGMVQLVSLIRDKQRDGQRELKRLATTDHLTGLRNRAYLERILEPMTEGLPTAALILLDVDNFKKVNDSYGHLTGDRVLGVIADSLRKLPLPGAVPCRIGGDEFAVFIPATTEKAGYAIARRLVQHTAEVSAFGPFGRRIGVTVSAGVSAAKPGPDLLTRLYAAADAALYEAKAAGRNTAVAWSSCESSLPRALDPLQQKTSSN